MQPAQGARLFRFLREGDTLYGLLEGQAAFVHEASVTFVRLLDGVESTTGVNFAVDRIEADEERAYFAIEVALARALLLRIDREDIHRVAAGLHAVRAASTSGIRSSVTPPATEPTSAMRQLAAILVEATDLISQAIRKLRASDYAAVSPLAREIHLRHRSGTEIHHAELSSLLRSDDTTGPKDLIRETFELRNVERTLSQCSSLGRQLLRIAIKNG